MGLWMPELVLYGKSLLAKQFLGSIVEIEVDTTLQFAEVKGEGIIFNPAKVWSSEFSKVPKGG